MVVSRPRFSQAYVACAGSFGSTLPAGGMKILHKVLPWIQLDGAESIDTFSWVRQGLIFLIGVTRTRRNQFLFNY